jgi:predicted amidohydrolase YtcJ
MHAFDCALALRHVSCLPPAVDSLTGLKQRLADRAGSLPAGAWVVATGYDDTRLREKRPVPPPGSCWKRPRSWSGA